MNTLSVEGNYEGEWKVYMDSVGGAVVMNTESGASLYIDGIESFNNLTDCLAYMKDRSWLVLDRETE